MTLATLLAFAATSAIIILIPGPTVLLVVSYALGQGRRVAVPIAGGVALGDLTAMTLSLLGAGALLAASADLFTALRWAGAAYLIWLGLKLFRAGGTAPAEGAADAPAPGDGWRMFGHAWLVTALNPKSLVFFIAFVPQFIDPAHSYLAQMLVLELVFVGLATLNVFGYALLASRARGLVRRPAVMRGINRAGGAVLVAAGLATIAFDRPVTGTR